MVEHPLDQYASMLPLEVCAELETTPQGLAEEEARARLERYGPNQIGEEEPRIFRRIVVSFANWITLLLLIAGVLAMIGETPAIGVAILFVALLNGLFTVWQEYLAERAIAALRHLLPPTTYVRRAGQVRQAPTSEIVPGDILPLKPNTMVVADGYLIAGEGLRVKQTMLTGNSAPVTKVPGPMTDQTLALTERPNLLLAGTVVIEGQGSVLAVATGMRTQLGEVAESTAALRAEQSTLGQALGRFVGTISRVAIAAGLGAFLLTLLVQGRDWREAIIFGIGMIVAFVPEGLLPTVTLALALARRRLARHGVLVKRLAGVESLGSATVLCLDKVGGSAPDRMTVSAVWAGGSGYQVMGSGATPEGAFLRGRALVHPAEEQDLAALLRAAALSSNARLVPPEGDQTEWRTLGDSVEGALLVAAARGGVDAAALALAAPRLHSFPYDPRRQMMGVVTATGEGGRDPVAYVRGSCTAVFPLCSHILRDGAAHPLDEPARQGVLDQLDLFARTGQRVLALAERRLEAHPDGGGWRAHEIEHGLTLLGLVALQEPPQPEITQLVEGCRRAGLRLLITTGAYGLTAEASARRAGIIVAPQIQIIQGAELDGMDDEALRLALAREDAIFAQLGAEQKRRIVTALQERGEVVAFLGDSINDAPALKQADVGVAVSASGTTVALAAADIVLNADHPAGLLLALEEGRAIFSNIQKFTTYIFAHNVAEAVVIVAGVVLRWPLPLTVLQVLAIDLGTELFPSVGLSAEAPEPGILDRPPRARSAPLIDQAVLFRAFGWLGLIEGALALGAYLMAAGWNPFALPEGSLAYAQATTLTYAAIVLAQVGNAFASRTRHTPLWQVGFLTNRALLIGVLISIAAMLALIYIPPVARIVGFVPPSPLQWLVVLSFAPILLVAEETRKWLLRRREVGRADVALDRARTTGGS